MFKCRFRKWSYRSSGSARSSRQLVGYVCLCVLSALGRPVLRRTNYIYLFERRPSSLRCSVLTVGMDTHTHSRQTAQPRQGQQPPPPSMSPHTPGLSGGSTAHTFHPPPSHLHRPFSNYAEPFNYFRPSSLYILTNSLWTELHPHRHWMEAKIKLESCWFLHSFWNCRKLEKNLLFSVGRYVGTVDLALQNVGLSLGCVFLGQIRLIIIWVGTYLQ